MGDPKTTSLALAKWATEELRFRCAANTGTDKLASTLLPVCKGSAMLNFWDEVIARVRTKQKAAEIRDNLELHDLLEQGQKSSQHLAELQRECEVLEKDTELLRLQLKKYKEDLQFANLKLSSERQKENMVQIRCCLHKQYSGYLTFKESGINSFSKWFEELCQAYRHAAQHKDSQTCQSEVRNVYSLFLNKIQASSDRGQNIPESLLSSLGNLLKNFPPESIAGCIQALTENSTAKLKTDEESVNFAQDLQNFEEKCHARLGQSADGRLATLRKMLERWDLECVKSRTECLNCTRSAEENILESERERTRIIERLEEVYEHNPSALQLAVDTLDAGVELANMQGCLRSFQSSFSRLQRDITAKSHDRDQLLKLKEKIDGFSNATEENQVRIISVTKHNSTVKSKLCKRQEEVRQVAKSSVCDRKADVTTTCTDLQTALQDQTRAFGASDIAKLLVVKIGDDTETPQNRLTINRYSDMSYLVGGDTYQRTLHALNIHHDTLPSVVMQRIHNMQADVSRSRDMEKSLERLASPHAQCQTLKELEEQTVDSEKKQFKLISAKFKHGSEIAEGAVEHANALERLIDVWYNQPAQDQVPWLKVDGLSLAEWKKKLDMP